MDKECRDQHEESDERGPERHHVEARKRHILRAYLNGKKVISKSSEWRIRENEKDHDGSVHGHEREVVFGRHHAARSAIGREMLQTRNGEAGPSK